MSNLASDHAPDTLWRLCSVRKRDRQKINHVNWFVSRASAAHHASWIKDHGGRILSLDQYVKASEELETEDANQ